MKKVLSLLLVAVMMLPFLSSCGSEEQHVHSFSEWESLQSATCTQEGIRRRYCSCGEIQEEKFSTVAHKYEGGKCVWCNSDDPNVAKISLSSLSIVSNPNKLKYTVGDTLDITGLSLKAIYSDDSEKNISKDYNYYPTVLNSSGIQTITVTYEDKSATFEVTVENIPVTLTDISITSLPDKLVYNVGENINTAGLKLEATYSDGSKKTITDAFSCTPSTFVSIGTTAVTVSYADKIATFNVTVNEAQITLSSISLVSAPVKTVYNVGDVLNTAGLKLKAIYSNGSTQTITDGFTCSSVSLNEAGIKTITVSYGGKSITFNITVNAITLTGITVKTLPTKTTYYVGEPLDTTGLALCATYSDNSTQNITSGFTCTPVALTTARMKTITVNYGGKTATFNVTVKDIALTEITVKTAPAKTEYFVGDQLDTTGLILCATYSNNSTQNISSGFTCSPTSLTEAGTKTIFVNYGGKTATFNVTVKEITLTDITIKTAPNKNDYFVGDQLDTTGLTLCANYSDGSTKIVTSGFTCSTVTLNAAGTKIITVSYGGKTATFSVTVKETTLTGITIKTAPARTEYFLGEKLDTTGLTICASFNDGSIQTLTSGFTCSPTVLDSIGVKTITITYFGKTTSFSVTVKEVLLTEITVKTAPSKTNYYAGGKLDTTGLVICASYSDGSSKDIMIGYTCSPTTLSDAGTQTITVTYDGKSTTFNVSVSYKKISKDVEVGDIVLFGSYEQDNNTSNGTEAIEWLILAKDGNNVLAISKYGLDCRQFHTSNSEINWECSAIRTWLNNDFLNAAFTADEQKYIQSSTVTADKNPEYTTISAGRTVSGDKIFLLSTNEANKYLSTEESRKCKATPYALANGATFNNSYKYADSETCWWWLRTPGSAKTLVSYVKTDGSIYNYGHRPWTDPGCVRPVIWFSLDQ